MIKKILGWFKLPSIDLHEEYLSRSVDMCDLERRLEKIRHRSHIVW